MTEILGFLDVVWIDFCVISLSHFPIISLYKLYWNVAVTLFDSFMVIWIESSLLETSPDQLVKNDSSFFGIGVSFMTVPSAKLSSLVMVLVFTISFSTEPRPWMLIAKEYFFSSWKTAETTRSLLTKIFIGFSDEVDESLKSHLTNSYPSLGVAVTVIVSPSLNTPPDAFTDPPSRAVNPTENWVIFSSSFLHV